jgi:DNA-binding PadR family transcriptional regulator
MAARTSGSNETLAPVGRSDAGAHDLLRLGPPGPDARLAGESQHNAEPKRLARLGYLEARREPGKTRERTVDRLTGKGRDALREYAATPVSFTPLESEPLLRLLIAELVGEPATRAGLLGLRDELVDLGTRLDESETAAVALPHRSKYLLLVTAFLRSYLELHETLIDVVERELSAAPAPVEAADTPRPDAPGARRDGTGRYGRVRPTRRGGRRGRPAPGGARRRSAPDRAWRGWS